MKRMNWQPYTADADNPWTLAKVGHVYRRLGFGANRQQLEAGLKLGPEKLLDSFLKPEGQVQERGEAFHTETLRWAEPIRQTNNATRLSEWQMYRLMYHPLPLQEKMTLFWQNHFATSYAKVLNARYMIGQYTTLYQQAMGNFRPMLQAMTIDPAMLIWLDGIKSVKGMPNENYARELMELFSLGIGHYTEKDIREAARALTGWTIENGQATFDNKRFDNSDKKVFGKQSNFQAEGIVNLCLDQPACAEFLIQKLYRFFFHDTLTLPKEDVQELAREFRTDYDIRKLLNRMLRSQAFFDAMHYRTKVKSPVEWLVSIFHAFDARVGVPEPSRMLESLGQHLFHPPSVKGWDGGTAWLNGQTLLTRQNTALKLCEMRQQDAGQSDSLPLAMRPLLTRNQLQTTDSKEWVRLFLELFLQETPGSAIGQKLTQFVQQEKPAPSFWSEGRKQEQKIIALAHLVLTLPEAQLN